MSDDDTGNNTLYAKAPHLKVRPTAKSPLPNHLNTPESRSVKSSRNPTPDLPPPHPDLYQTDNEISENEAEEEIDKMASSNNGDNHPSTTMFDDSISEVYEAVENYTFGINDGPDDADDNDSMTGTASNSSASGGGGSLSGVRKHHKGPGITGTLEKLVQKQNTNNNGSHVSSSGANGNGNGSSSHHHHHQPSTAAHDDEDEYNSNAETESTCSMEECVARIESTLRRNFRKIQSRNNNNNQTSSGSAAAAATKMAAVKDVTQLPGYQAVPENCPTWKKAMIEKKNAQLLDDAKKEVAQKKAEEDKWRDVPAWKKNLILEKEKKSKDVESPTEQEKIRKEEEMRRLEAMPEWKRKIILQKRGDN